MTTARVTQFAPMGYARPVAPVTISAQMKHPASTERAQLTAQATTIAQVHRYASTKFVRRKVVAPQMTTVRGDLYALMEPAKMTPPVRPFATQLALTTTTLTIATAEGVAEGVAGVVTIAMAIVTVAMDAILAIPAIRAIPILAAKGSFLRGPTLSWLAWRMDRDE